MWNLPMNILYVMNHNQVSILVSRVLRAINSMNFFPCWTCIVFTVKNLQNWTWQKRVIKIDQKLTELQHFLELIMD